MKLIGNEKALNVPIDADLRKQLKKEAKANGLQLREAVNDALILWLQMTEYLRHAEDARAAERAKRRAVVEGEY